MIVMNIYLIKHGNKMKQKYLLSTYKRQEVSFERGDNATLWDSEGKEYIDFAAGVAVCSVGHGNRRLARA